MINRRLRLALLLLSPLLCAPAGCERERPRTVLATQPAEPILNLEMTPLTPLVPNRPTHTAVDRLGNVYWVQESDRGDDTMFVIGEGGIPRATQLSAANIAVRLGADRGARGNIHGIAAAGGNIYFYFHGVHDRRTIAAVGTFDPRSEAIRILADTDALAAATGMGRSLPLARGSVVSDGQTVWIWLRHTDNWAVFRIDPDKLPTTGPARLPRAFETVTLNGTPIDLTREEMEIAPAPGGALFLMDVAGARLLKIAPGGAATLVRSLVGLPRLLSSPSVDREQNLVLFAANADRIDATAQQQQPALSGRVDLTFPAMLIFKPDDIVAIEREQMHAYPGFQVFGTRLRQLVPHPRENGWISYDASSGELLRVKVVQSLWP